MTNEEKIKSLPLEELAWILLNNCTSQGRAGCGFCIYKDYDRCKVVEGRKSCIDGHLEFLKREQTEDDMRMYSIAKNNVVVGKYNEMSNEEKLNHKIVNVNGYATNIIKIGG